MTHSLCLLDTVSASHAPAENGCFVIYSRATLDALTIKNRTPIPRIDDLLDQVKGACTFTALDLAAGYHQIPIPEHECERTAFFGESELWEYTVMPFGLCNAPGVFTAAATRILDKYINVFVLAYLDDISMYSKTPEEHLNHVRLVLDEFKECKIVCRAHKCRFNRLSLPYLGHILSAEGVISASFFKWATYQNFRLSNRKYLSGLNFLSFT